MKDLMPLVSVGLQAAGDLLGAPGLGPLDIDKNPCIISNAGAILPGLHGCLSMLLGLPGPVALLAVIAPHFPMVDLIPCSLYCYDRIGVFPT